MNGRVMDVFHRKDMAEGIFYEYLRMDDPISSDFQNRVVDGFPFLLAPLAQVKGVHLGQGQSATKPQGNPIVRSLFNVYDTLHSSVVSLASTLQTGTVASLAHTIDAAKSFGDMSRSAGKDIVDRRGELLEHILSFPDFVMGIINRDNNSAILETVSEWVNANITPTEQELRVVRRDSLGRAFGYPLSRWFSDTYTAPDEIGPMTINPTMDMPRRIFLAFVHVYLLLLFIVSFPGSYSSRTKLIVRKNLIRLDQSDNGSLSSMEDSEAAEKDFGNLSDCSEDDHQLTDISHQAVGRSKRMIMARARRVLRPSNSNDDRLTVNNDATVGSPLKKKSLSYFL
jgi:hypothetical protein